MPDFLRSALSAIPHVVGDTRALIAYALAIAAWTAVALKVQRNKSLLTNINKLPERDRLSALQLEMGSIPLPAGISATQYLKARVHTYYFWAFVVLCTLIATILALSITFRFQRGDELSKEMEQALEHDREKVAASAAGARIHEVQDKIESLALRRIPEYYVQEFGQPTDKGRDGGISYLQWNTGAWQLDIAFEGGRSTELCVVSRDKNFRPLVPSNEDSFRLGEKTLSQVADKYLWHNYGSAGGSTVVAYGLNGSHADDFLYGYVASVDANPYSAGIPGNDSPPMLQPQSREAGTEAAPGDDPVNAFSISTYKPSATGPRCLEYPLWEPWK